MADARTKKMVENARANGSVKAHRESLKRQQIDVDLTTGGQLATVEPESIEVAEVVEIEEKSYLTKAQGNVEAIATTVDKGLINLKGFFEDILKPECNLARMAELCGKASQAELEEAQKTAIAIHNALDIKSLELGVKRSAVKVRRDEMLLQLEQLEAQIQVARKANKVAGDQDSLEHEIDLRGLKQQRNANEASHVSEVNSLIKSDQDDYRSSKRQRNEQQAIIRQATVASITAFAVVATKKAQNRTDWANSFTAPKPKESR